MAVPSSEYTGTKASAPHLVKANHNQFFGALFSLCKFPFSTVGPQLNRNLIYFLRRNRYIMLWREFLWGGIAGAFGEGMMHPIDTVKTRLQSQAILSGYQNQKSILQMVRTVWATDGLRGFYRGIAPGVTGSLATGATYFGVIESTKKWIEEKHPGLGGHWAHFIAGAVGELFAFFTLCQTLVYLEAFGHIRPKMLFSPTANARPQLIYACCLESAGDTLGSVVYVPCEVMKQRMQIQGNRKYWSSVVMKQNAGMKPGMEMYGYYSGMFQAGSSIWKEQGLKGLYAGYWSTLARDVPFAGLMVTFYEALKDLTEYGKKKWMPSSSNQVNSSLEGLLLGGLAGGFSAYLTTPLDVVKTRLQIQGPTLSYSGWLDAVHGIWKTEGIAGMFRGSVPRIMWYIPASALTFMAVEFLRDHFNEELSNDKVQELASLSIDKKRSSLREVSS
ncbi:hypothetical protein RHMOL_Rhmol12G0177700 [Rhododendron molle]|uniref:Uncharacterized protein n=1 Tax=Rhododendron molle TaxID=49168 RepID=A0ACC0LJ93_RHOML|nr:hypothetical protein RHMOL_Rhmol12G0177700 [Rhododendron molle]